MFFGKLDILCVPHKKKNIHKLGDHNFPLSSPEVTIFRTRSRDLQVDPIENSWFNAIGLLILQQSNYVTQLTRLGISSCQKMFVWSGYKEKNKKTTLKPFKSWQIKECLRIILEKLKLYKSRLFQITSKKLKHLTHVYSFPIRQFVRQSLQSLICSGTTLFTGIDRKQSQC